MYIDFLKNDYSDKPEQDRDEYINRDKKNLGGIIQEKISNDINNIVERWYELNDIGYIPENEKFLYLLKEAEQLYCFAYYTGTISIVGIACEEYCRYLINKHGLEDKDKQCNRINQLRNNNVIDENMKNNLHKIRKIRNNCIHYNIDFKELDEEELKQNAFDILNLYKLCLKPLTIDSKSIDYDVENKILESLENTFKEFLYRTRNIRKNRDNIDLQIKPNIKRKIITSYYYIAEIDIETNGFKEMTLLDINNPVSPFVVDLTLPQASRIKEINLQEGNIIIATVISAITDLGQTEEFQLLNIEDIYRVYTNVNDLSKLINIWNIMINNI